MAKTNHRNKQKVPHQTKGRARRAREPQTFPVDGHELTQSQWEAYQEACVQAMAAISRPTEEQARQARRVALSNVLYRDRPSTKAQDRFLSLGLQISQVGTVVCGARHYTFCQRDPRLLRAYNDTLGYAVDEIAKALEELREIHAGIAQEAQEVSNA